MNKVLSSAQMREYDRYAIGQLGIPGVVLMENAGANVVQEILAEYGPVSGKSVLIIAGKGNNGGDGFVIARQLLIKAARVSVLLLGKAGELKGDALLNYKVLDLIRKQIDPENLSIDELPSAAFLKKIPIPDILVDAIFGTGFSGSITGTFRKVIEWMNTLSAFKVAVDVPSGLNSDTGEICGSAIKVNLTVTMGFIKPGLLLNNAIAYAGLVKVVSIGAVNDFPASIRANTFQVCAADVSSFIPYRRKQAHKYQFKKTLVVAGSRGMSGAAAMAANATLRTGGGMVILCTPQSAYPVLAQKLTEVMVTPVPETAEGSFGMDSMAVLSEKFDWSDLLILGPGLSKNKETQSLVRRILAEYKKPIILDADGINAVNCSFLRELRRGNTLTVTPHTAELSHLTGITPREIERNRVEVARNVASDCNVIFVLKGAPTVTASPDGNVYINSTGNPILATPGSGDILTGIIAGLQSQHIDPISAAFSGVFIHGLAADLRARKIGDRGLLATDLLSEIPITISQILLKHGN